jgi:hypothetical protein
VAVLFLLFFKDPPRRVGAQPAPPLPGPGYDVDLASMKPKS